MKQKRKFLPLWVLSAVAVLCLGVYGLMQYFGSPLLPGSLERRYAREVSSHQEELLDFSQKCLETRAVPEDQSLPGFIREVQLAGQGSQNPEDLFVEFSCDGWGLVPSSSYYGFYYSPQGPRAFQGVEELPRTEAMPGRQRGTITALPGRSARVSTTTRPISKHFPRNGKQPGRFRRSGCLAVTSAPAGFSGRQPALGG